MRKIRYIAIFCFLFFTAALITVYPMEVKGANYNVSVGDTWTSTYTGGGTNVQTAFKVTSVSSSNCDGNIYEIGSDDVGEEKTNQNLASSYVKDLIAYAGYARDGTPTKTYAGRSLTCWQYNNPTTSLDLLIIDSLTGIVVERQFSNGKTEILISWEYLTTRAGAVPGYDLPILLSITAIFSIGVIFYIRKKQI